MEKLNHLYFYQVRVKKDAHKYDELIQQVNSINPSKKFIFPKNSYVGWISGYIMNKINKQYLGLAKK